MSKIEWTDESWNPVTGCTKISEGCENCYAERMAKRLAGRHGYPKEAPFRPTFHEDRLGQPGRRRKPRKIFVASMGDLFHRDIHFNEIGLIFNAAFAALQHTYIILTKRPTRMLHYFNSCRNLGVPVLAWERHGLKIWKGVSAEDNRTYARRWRYLSMIQSRVRFISA